MVCKRLFQQDKVPLTIILCLTVFLTMEFFGDANAHQGATGIVKERMQVMKGIGEASKALAKMAKGEETFDPVTVKKMTDIIVAQSSQDLRYLFPDGSLEHPSEALPSIWTNWDKYEQQWSDMKRATLEVATTGTRSREDLLASFSKLSATCRDCHESFRKD